MNHDAVFYGVIACVAGAVAVVGWLTYVVMRNISQGNEKKQ